jgi:DNA-binding MarR family transcriptional regulator
MAQEGEAAGIPDVLADRLGFLLGRAHLDHRRLAAARLSDIGLDPREFGALSVLADLGPMTQQRLGRIMGIDRTTMVAIADALEEKGLAVRERDPADRRAYALRATGRGRRVLGRAARATARAEDEFLAPLTERQRAQLRSMLRRLISSSHPT